MPELPEVETTCLGIKPHLIGKTIGHIDIREHRMRWPIDDIILSITGQKIQQVSRRAKYILIEVDTGILILHLGMSGSLRICPAEVELKKHDHFILGIKNSNDMEMRLHDPRRFGAVLWHPGKDWQKHNLLEKLGPEPLSDHFTPELLHEKCRRRTTTIKQAIMNNHIVVGVGNIYACEALFRSGIHPQRKANQISKRRMQALYQEIRKVLAEAIAQGGTTLRDFLREDGQPGYFKQKLYVYDREGDNCRKCKKCIKRVTISNRSTFYCPGCQT